MKTLYIATGCLLMSALMLFAFDKAGDTSIRAAVADQGLAGREAEGHGFRLVGERAEAEDGGLAIVGLLQGGDEDLGIVEYDRGLDGNRLLRRDGDQRLVLFQAKAVGGDRIIGSMR